METHSIHIDVKVNGVALGIIDKTVDGTREDALAEITATLQRNRVANEGAVGMTYDVILDGEKVEQT